MRFVHVRGEVRRDPEGRPVGMRGSAQDITERKKAEEELARLATIVAQSDDAIIGMNTEGAIFSWNAGAEKLFGYTAAEAQGQNIVTFVSPKRNTRIRHNLDLILAGEPLRHFESLCRKKDGTHFYTSLTISPVRDENGTMFGMIFIARNITEGKRARNALLESEQKYRSLFETMAQAVLTIDARGNVLESNPAAGRLLGLAREPGGKAVLGPGLDAVRADGTRFPDDAFPWVLAFRTGKEVREIMGVANPADAKRRWVIALATPNYPAGRARAAPGLGCIQRYLRSHRPRSRDPGTGRTDKSRGLKSHPVLLAAGFPAYDEDGPYLPVGSKLRDEPARVLFRAVRYRGTGIRPHQGSGL